MRKECEERKREKLYSQNTILVLLSGMHLFEDMWGGVVRSKGFISVNSYLVGFVKILCSLTYNVPWKKCMTHFWKAEWRKKDFSRVMAAYSRDRA